MGIFDFFGNKPKDLSTNFPTFKFELPKPKITTNKITSDLEGKWKGMVLQDVYNYEVRDKLADSNEDRISRKT